MAWDFHTGLVKFARIFRFRLSLYSLLSMSGYRTGDAISTHGWRLDHTRCCRYDNALLSNFGDMYILHSLHRYSPWYIHRCIRPASHGWRLHKPPLNQPVCQPYTQNCSHLAFPDYMMRWSVTKLLERQLCTPADMNYWCFPFDASHRYKL